MTNVTCGDLEILLVLIGLKVKGLKPDRKDWIRVTPGLVLRKGGEGVM